MKQYIQDDLDLTDTQTSIPLTTFIIVYMCCSPVFSHLADHGFKRPRLIASGVFIWSVATAAGALAFNFWTFLVSRSLVGVGEAAYATIAPALLSDFYRPDQRSTVLSIFYMAIPIGAAMGYGIGGEVGGALGWRYGFLISGAPGIIVAFLCLQIIEPQIGALDHVSASDSEVGVSDSSAATTTTLATGTTSALPRSRRHSAHDLMFGLNAAGMQCDSDDDLAPDHDAFAVGNELGGPAPMHPSTLAVTAATSPNTRRISDASAHATRPMSNTILVRSRAPTIGDEESSTERLQEEDGITSDGGLPPHMQPPPWKESVILLLHNRTYMFATMGLAFVTFASGGLADWFPSWLNRVHDVKENTASTLVGALTCVAGIIGTAYGSWAGDRMKGVIRQPYLGVPAVNMIITTACTWLVMIMPNVYLIGGLIFIAQVAMWAYTGPINALTINSVPSNMRVRAFAFQIFVTHALGDAVSPTIVGAVSDATNSIRTAMLLIPLAFSIGLLIWFIGWRVVNETFDGSKPLHDGHSAAAVAATKSNFDSLSDPLIPLAVNDHHNTSIDVDDEYQNDAINLKRLSQQYHQPHAQHQQQAIM